MSTSSGYPDPGVSGVSAGAADCSAAGNTGVFDRALIGGRTLRGLGITITVLAECGDSTVIEYVAPPGFSGPPPHVHRESCEWFRILTGRAVFTLPEGEAVLEAGGSVEIPRGIVHTWRNGSATEPLHMLFGFDRPGLAGYFDRLMHLAATAAEWPPEDRSAIAALGEAYDIFPPG